MQLETKRFEYPLFPACFTIPHEWWIAAGMHHFIPTGESYHCTVEHKLIVLAHIIPAVRNRTANNDHCGFSYDRMVSVLKGIAESSSMLPIVAVEFPSVVPNKWITPNPFRYRVHDGYHRYHASVAAGFSVIPAVIVPSMITPLPDIVS